MNQENVFYATGKRKSAIARTWLRPGSGVITINNKPIDKYFTVESAVKRTLQALTLSDLRDSVDVTVTVKGGGFTGQAGAIRHGITKALLAFQPDLRGSLKKAGYITRDPRVKERKKYGQKGARARFQFSKR
ncbi:MAG: 30S ribosomal protein S9 [Desulfatibacillum sp.]|nr:30S ribosomal protein S9 [Desulfatibacillum sp.]